MSTKTIVELAADAFNRDGRFAARVVESGSAVEIRYADTGRHLTTVWSPDAITASGHQLGRWTWPPTPDGVTVRTRTANTTLDDLVRAVATSVLDEGGGAMTTTDSRTCPHDDLTGVVTDDREEHKCRICGEHWVILTERPAAHGPYEHVGAYADLAESEVFDTSGTPKDFCPDCEHAPCVTGHKGWCGNRPRFVVRRRFREDLLQLLDGVAGRQNPLEAPLRTAIFGLGDVSWSRSDEADYAYDDLVRVLTHLRRAKEAQS